MVKLFGCCVIKFLLVSGWGSCISLLLNGLKGWWRWWWIRKILSSSFLPPFPTTSSQSHRLHPPSSGSTEQVASEEGREARASWKDQWEGGRESPLALCHSPTGTGGTGTHLPTLTRTLTPKTSLRFGERGRKRTQLTTGLLPSSSLI